ncbi:MAG: ribonuclease H-like domain-containing protein, partial [Gammaproteobacteria bacterium]|nr:ribonuclease H-like domain-containing protein [Gammaproteobacteria bacterium]
HVVHDGVIGIREQLTTDAVHGEFPLVDPTLRQALSLCTGEAGVTPSACVFMDTETTGLAGGTGTLVFLLGMARFSGGALEINQLFLTGFQGESAMLGAAQDYLRGADTLVTFNGRSFDSPLLAARYRLSGLSDPFAGLQHVDLLHPTRRTFKHRWPDCRLQTVERRLLGVARVGDLPGSEAPQAWFDWVRHGRDDALSAVCSHNRLDLLTLAVLPAALQRSHDDPIAADANVLACARHYCQGSGPGDEAAFEYLLRYRAGLAPDGLLELARMARRRGEWQLAVDLWERLAEAGVAVAVEHLAKYYEHEQRDYACALQVTARLLAHAPHDQQHLRRDARLRARLAAKRC